MDWDRSIPISGAVTPESDEEGDRRLRENNDEGRRRKGELRIERMEPMRLRLVG